MIQQNFVRGAIAATVLNVAIGGFALLQSGIAIAGPSDVRAVATDFSPIVEKYGPSVVNISVVGKAERGHGREGFPGFDRDDPMFEFFRRFSPQVPRNGPPGGHVLRGQGSGFIVSSTGLILTNAHVVDGAKEVTVKLTDRREFKAKVLGADRQSDVAVLKIEARDLPVVKLGDPAQTKVGEPVLAIGAPYGFENTATAGIVSAKFRSLPDTNYVNFIQTDVAVNPGNSGGPLFNMRGEVIGINSQIYSQTGGYQGLSFAIPMDVAGKVQAQLVAHGKVSRGRLGVSIQEVSQALSQSFGLKRAQGALISAVENGSPAEKAGVQVGDVIVKFDGKTVENSNDLPALVGDLKPGSSALMELVRKGSSKVVTVTIGEMKVAGADRDDGGEGKGRLGLAVRPMGKDERRRYGGSGGLLVEEASGPAARASIRPGDVILQVNGVAVNSAHQLDSLIEKSDRHVALLVQRGAAKFFVPVELG